MRKIALKIETKVNDKKVNLELTEEEVLTGYSICEKNSLNSVIVMKKHNGGAIFFTNESHAANTQQRHKFEYAFDVEMKDLKAEAQKILAAQKAASASASAKKKENSGG